MKTRARCQLSEADVLRIVDRSGEFQINPLRYSVRSQLSIFKGLCTKGILGRVIVKCDFHICRRVKT